MECCIQPAARGVVDRRTSAAVRTLLQLTAASAVERVAFSAVIGFVIIAVLVVVSIAALLYAEGFKPRDRARGGFEDQPRA